MLAAVDSQAKHKAMTLPTERLIALVIVGTMMFAAAACKNIRPSVPSVPSGAIAGKNPSIQDIHASAPERRTLTQADIIWSEDWCYLALNGLPGQPDGYVGFVTVPDDWCKGMR